MPSEEPGGRNGEEEVRFYICPKALPLPEIDPEVIKYLILHNDYVKMDYAKHVVLRNSHEKNIVLAHRIVSEKGRDQMTKNKMLTEIYTFTKDPKTRVVIRRMINDLSQL